MTGPFNSLVDQFNGNQINPSNSSYQSIDLTVDNSPFILQWPLIGVQAGQIVTNIIDVTAAAEDLAIMLPDATLTSVGQVVKFFNVGLNEFNLLDFDGGVIANVPVADNSPPTPPSSGAVFIYLKDNTTQAGVWGVISAGALTGAIQASLLAGNGLQVVGSKLETSLEVQSTLGPTYNVTPNESSPNASDRARFIIWAGGSGTINFPPVALAEADFFFAIGNQTSNGASILLQTPDGALIDGEPTMVLGDGQTAIWATDGLNWFSLGLGTPSFFNTTVLVKDLSPVGGGTLTLTSDESNRTIIYFVTNTTPLTSNITILFTASPKFNFITNNITNNGFTLTVAANGGAVTNVIPVGETFIFMNNGLEMFAVPTSVASGSIVFPDGSAGFPSIRYQGAPSSGGYLAGPDELGWSINGNQVLGIDEFGLNIYTNGTLSEPVFNYVGAPGGTGTYLNVLSNYVGHTYGGILGAAIGSGFLGIADGTSIAPSLVFISDDITGIYKAGTGAIGFASESAQVAVIDALGFATISGVATNPSYAFIGDSITGIYNPALHTIGFATNAVLTATITTTGLELLSHAGTATLLSFENPAGTHFTTFVSGATIIDNNYTLPPALPTISGQVLSCTTGGVMSWIDNNVTTVSLADGTAAAPSLNFVTHPTTGIYEPAANTIGFSAAGSLIASINSAGITLKNGSSSLPSLNFVGSTGTGLYYNSGLYVSVLAGDVALFTSGGFTLLPNKELEFENPAGTFVTSFVGGAVTGDTPYTLPIAYPALSGQALISSTSGVMGWSTTLFDADGSHVPFGSLGNPSIAFQTENVTGIYHPATNTIGFQTNGALAFTIDPNSITVVNTITPASNFSLQSPASPAANYTYIMPSSAPVVGKNLQVSNVAGTVITLDWV